MLKFKSFFLMSILISVGCSALIACGTKGPLYIPEQRYPQETTKPPVHHNQIDAEQAKQPSSKETQTTDKE
jgi:predicted small lipoprotein YifL